MDPFLARTMIETLSKGIDPVSGIALPGGDSCSQEEVQDALIEVLEHCSIESTEQYCRRMKKNYKQRRIENKIQYPRGGTPWESAEETELLSMHKAGKNIYIIANVLQRTPGAIADRLKKLNCQPIYRTKKTPRRPRW